MDVSMRGLWLKFRALVRRSRVEAELAEELRDHVERETEARVQRGIPRDEARRQALRDFGGVERHKEDCRDVRGTRWLDDTSRDTAYAIRALRRTPAFTTVAVLTLALGIGATTSIFGIVNAVTIRPLPYATPEALVTIHSTYRGTDNTVSGPDFLDWRAMARSFDGLAAMSDRAINLTGDGETPLRVRAERVSANLFALLRVRPIIGRTFAAGEDEPSRRQAVVVLGEQLWRERFGGDRAVIGRTVQLDGVATVIVGVVPRALGYPARAEMWIPLLMKDEERDPGNRGARWFDVVGRLGPGATLASATTEMQAIARRLATQYPENDTDMGVRLASLRDELVGHVDAPLLVLGGAVALMLLIACANVANLLVVRSMGRRGEMALRTALGANRWRLVRQLSVESLLLFGVGGAGGALFAMWWTRVLVRLAHDALPRLAEVRVDATAFAFAAAITGLTGIIFGVLPAVQAGAGSPGLAAAVRDGGRIAASSGRGIRGSGAQLGIVFVEVALSVVLLVGAGLLLHSFARLTRVEPGFDAAHALAMRVDLPKNRYADHDAERQFLNRALVRLAALPGVDRAAAVLATPLSEFSFDIGFWIDGRPLPKPEDRPSAQVRIASPGYFATIGIPLRRGREFAATDRAGAPRVVVINEAFARRHFPHEDPIGKRVWLAWAEDDGRRGGEVVGVVGDVHQFALDRPSVPELYVAFDQAPAGTMTLVLHTPRSPRAVVRAARASVNALDPELPVHDVDGLEAAVRASVSRPRFYAGLLGGFGLTAVVLAALGLYGVLAYAVQQRTPEIGIRIALGARGSHIARLIVGGAMRWVAVAIAVGAVAALLARRIIEALLFETTGTDPLTFGAVAVVLLATAWLASWLPARRAVRVDPMTALRAE